MTERFQPVEFELPDSVGPTTLPELEAMAEAKKLYLQKRDLGSPLDSRLIQLSH